MTKRLIEKRLPLEEISVNSKEKRTIADLHLWWARRPLAASRAGVFGTLVPDSQENYELVKDIVPWEAVKDGNSEAILKAREKVLAEYPDGPPKVLDPFGGGGAIPLEALRLGCETYSLDLNPVAHLIQRATLEYPQKFGQPTTRPAPEHIRAKDAPPQGKNHQAEMYAQDGAWASAYANNPLATEVRHWGEWVLERAKRELAEFYPSDPDGKTPVAYLWARTVTCTNPACRAEVPMVRGWWLAKKKDKKLAVKPIVNDKTVSYKVVEVKDGDTWMDEGTVVRGNAICLVCNTAISNSVVREQGMAGKIGQHLHTVVLTGSKQGKSYRAATAQDLETFSTARAALERLENDLQGFFTVGSQPVSPLPNEPINISDKRNFWVGEYGPKVWGDLFNPRQALALVTFAKWVREAHGEMLRAGIEEEEARGVATYLGFKVDRLADYGASTSSWHSGNEQIRNTFTRQALPMVWDYAETSSLGGASGSWASVSTGPLKVIGISADSSTNQAKVLRGSATRIPLDDNFLDAIITDPPYYDAVPYADLSDFFYVWLRRTVGHLYPSEFRTPLTPKAQEAVQNPVRHSGDNKKAKAFYEDMMTQAFKEMHRVLKPSGQATIVFAHKSTDAWETLISALISAGFCVEASWPLDTEMATRLRARASAALASSTFLTCSKRAASSVGYFNEVRQEMRASIAPQLKSFWDSGIRGADFFMSAIGPGLESYSRFGEVRRASGEPVGVGEFLTEVRKIVLEFALSQVMHQEHAQDALDDATQFALLSLWAYGYEFPSSEAIMLAQSTGVELLELSDLGLLEVKGENAKLLRASERSKKRPKLGLPLESLVGAASSPVVGAGVPTVDAMHRAMLLLKQGRQAIADYLFAVRYLDSESFWRTVQAFAEVLDETDEGRALDELLTLRDNLPKPNEAAAQVGLFG